jgi:hypothetical protein
MPLLIITKDIGYFKNNLTVLCTSTLIDNNNNNNKNDNNNNINNNNNNNDNDNK